MLKMATYPGMSLGGEVRESISLDEDDLSDVEDEVFIRDGKNSYKLAEELNVKRPLMAPRRKLGKPDLTSRLKAKPPCKAFCKPCCYIFAALSILIGLIIIVVILVSIFPLPLDKLRDWIISKAKPIQKSVKLLPCSNLKVTDIWATNLPILTTESPVRMLDVNGDGVDDIIFGFGTGDNYNYNNKELFCPIFLGVPPPCQGGVIALNGTNGDIVWRFWTNDTIFFLQCSADLNGDGLEDCLAIGEQGTMTAIESKNGSVIWLQNNNKMDVFVADFVPDQNNDSIADVLSAHTSLDAKEGHLLLISGKNGQEMGRVKVPYGAPTYFMPQLLPVNGSYLVIFGTGSPSTPGNLSVIPLESLTNGNLSSRTIHQDHFKGVLTQPVLVDITGDDVLDIVIAMFNSTLVAINGFTLQQLWNYTMPNCESNISPTPGFFTDDNVTDFLIIYETYDNILNYNYTKTYIIDGKTGKPVYSKAIGSAVASQMNGLTLQMEAHGFDMFLFWTTECTNVEIYEKPKNAKVSENKISDTCRRQFNTSSIMKLNALCQYDQPPGFEIYTSVNRTRLEFNNTKSPLKQIRDYFLQHPKLPVGSTEGQSEVYDSYMDDSRRIGVHKLGSSTFRHKDNRDEIAKDFMTSSEDGNEFDDWQPNRDQFPGDPELNNYSFDESDGPNLFNQKQMLYNEPNKNNRDPRSKDENQNKSKKKNLSDAKYGIYDYQNIKMAQNRILHDLSNIPKDILRDTYFKNRESQLRKSKFEQRDITSHFDKIKQNAELKTIIDEERKAAENASLNLWDLESERELQDREKGYWRGKRAIDYAFNSIRKITSVGAIAKSLNATTNSIDVIFVTYWQPTEIDIREMLKQELDDCFEEKRANDQGHSYQKTTEKEQESLYMSECEDEQENLKNGFSNFNQISKLNLGQMTVYRIKIECMCDVQNVGERCAKFLPQIEQSWPMYLGKKGDGVFHTRN